MKSAKVLYKIAYLLIVVLVAVFTVGYAFAWFFDRKEAEFSITGSSQGAYFESGDGSAEKPFVISNPTHMHNLAVLQNTGKLDTKYYYEIKKTITEIDMSGRYIPPIGNDEHPFIGDFNGNGKTLAGLQVTTNKTLLKDEYPRHADTNYEFSQAVGLFGMTGADSNIHNLILDNPTVDVSATDTLYLTTAKDGVSPAAKAAGIAVGFVAGKVSSVGVRAANAALNVNMTGYSSFNSILGELADGVTSSVTGGGKPESGDVGYGAPTDLKELYEALGNKDGAAVEKQMALPFKVDNSKLIVPSSGTMNVELSSGVKPVSTATTQVATSSNIGYYIGADIKGYCKPKKVDYSKFYYPNNSSESFELPYTDYSGKVYPAPDSDVTDYLSKTGSYLMRMTGKTQVDVINESGLVVIPEGQVGSYKGPVLLPQRCVWVAPIMPGKLRFVFMNVESSAIGVRIVKLTRSVPGKYGTRFAGEREIIYNCNALMLSGKAYYIEMEVTQADINAGYEFAVAAGDGYNPYIAYIDIGANGGNVNLGEIDTQKNVSAVDFIYDGVEINQEKTGNEGGEGIQLGDFVIKASEPLTRYEASKTSIYFDNIKAAMEIVFLRLHNHEKGKTINLTNYTSDTIKTSELKATFANFVLPEGITGGTSSGGSSGGGEVVEVPTTAINVTSEKTSIAIGETVQLSVEFTPSNATDRAIDWSIESGAEYATLNDVTGEITGTADGTVVVKAQCGQFTDTITLTIGNGTTTTVAVESVSLNKTALSLTVDGSETLSATVSPSGATNKDVTWSSDKPSVATVDSNGKVTAVGEGTATITVTTADGGFTAQCTVTVSAAAFHSGTFTFTAPDTVSAGSGYTGNLTDIVTYATKNPPSASGGWQLDSNANYVNLALNVQSGKVITISLNGRRTGASAQGVNIYVGDTLLGLIDLTTTDAQGDKTLSYTATADGVINLKFNRSAGSGTNISKIVVNIADAPTTPTVSDVTITNGETASVVQDETLQLGATVTMSDGTTNNNVTWSSGNIDIATVDSSGNVTAVGVGEVTVTATSTDDSTKSASITITVTAATVAVTDITIVNTTVKAGETLDLTATVTPDNATDKTVEWTIKSSSSGVNASFSDTGLFVAENSASGTVTLTATVGSFSKDFEITVTAAQSGGETVTGEISLPSNNSGALNINDGANPPVITVSSSNTWTSGKVPDGSGQVDAIYTSTNNQSVTVKSTKRATVTLVVGASNSNHDQTENGTFTFTSNDNTHTINNVSVAKPSSNSYVVQATVTLNLAENEEITITCDKRFVLFSISYEYNQ